MILKKESDIHGNEIKTEVVLLTMSTAHAALLCSELELCPFVGTFCVRKGTPQVKEDPVLPAGQAPGLTAWRRCQGRRRRGPVRPESSLTCFPLPVSPICRGVAGLTNLFRSKHTQPPAQLLSARPLAGDEAAASDAGLFLVAVLPHLFLI